MRLVERPDIHGPKQVMVYDDALDWLKDAGYTLEVIERDNGEYPGTHIIATVAERMDVPSRKCSASWRFDGTEDQALRSKATGLVIEQAAELAWREGGAHWLLRHPVAWRQASAAHDLGYGPPSPWRFPYVHG